MGGEIHHDVKLEEIEAQLIGRRRLLGRWRHGSATTPRSTRSEETVNP
jgi:hypothetical protein